MSLIVESSSSGKLVEEGSHVGTLVKIVELGLQDRGEYKGEKLADAEMIGLTFELPNELIDDDPMRPVHLYKEVTKAKHPKSTLHVIALALKGGSSKAAEELGRRIVLADLLGKSAALTIGVTSGGKSKIVSASPLMKGTQVPAPKSELVTFDLDNHTQEELDKLPRFIREKIEKRLTSTNKSQPVNVTQNVGNSPISVDF